MRSITDNKKIVYKLLLLLWIIWPSPATANSKLSSEAHQQVLKYLTSTIPPTYTQSSHQQNPGNTSSSLASPNDLMLTTFKNKSWNWIDVPESFCGNGEPSGFSFYYNDQAEKISIVLMGGGACFDYETCFNQHTAIHFSEGFQRHDFERPFINISLVTRFITYLEPFSHSHIAIFPYCTGDNFLGEQVVTYEDKQKSHKKNAFHMGQHNMKFFLNILKQYFPKPQKILLLGTSAGGFGSNFNFSLVQKTFPKSALIMVSDSAFAPHNIEIPASWHFNVQSACHYDCDDNMASFSLWQIRQNPHSIFGFTGYLYDNILPEFYKILASSFKMNDFTKEYQEFISEAEAMNNVATYIDPYNPRHAIFTNPFSNIQNITPLDWLSKIDNDQLIHISEKNKF